MAALTQKDLRPGMIWWYNQVSLAESMMIKITNSKSSKSKSKNICNGSDSDRNTSMLHGSAHPLC